MQNQEAILQTWTLPRVDTFSYTRAGQPWFAWEWLSDVVFAASTKRPACLESRYSLR